MQIDVKLSITLIGWNKGKETLNTQEKYITSRLKRYKIFGVNCFDADLLKRFNHWEGFRISVQINAFGC